MDGKTMAQVGILTVALGAAAFFGFRNAKTLGEDSDFTTRRMSYVCSDPKCGTGFDVSMKEIRNAEDGIRCPTCKSLGTNAFKCAACGKMNMPVGHGQVPKKCEYCKATLVVDDPNEKKK